MNKQEMLRLFETHRDAEADPFREGLMAGESIYFDLATLCDQAQLPIDDLRAAAKARRAQ